MSQAIIQEIVKTLSPENQRKILPEIERPSEPQSDGLLIVTDEIIRQITIVDGWYEMLQGDLWPQLKIRFPGICENILSSRDLIDDIFASYRLKSKTWEDVQNAILEYSERWQILYNKQNRRTHEN